MKKDNKTTAEQRCKILAALISGIQESYSSATEDQKAFIETTIGAALWYVPKIDESFSGLISIELVKYYQNQGEVKISEEHIYPRRISASELLSLNMINAEIVYKKYKEKYCKLCYITPQENKAVIKFQKKGVFNTPIEAYKKANIILVKIDKKEFQLLKQKDKKVIEELLKRKPETQI